MSHQTKSVVQVLHFVILTVALVPAIWAVEADDSLNANWSRFRVPRGDGVIEPVDSIPCEFGPDKNILWSRDFPSGHSSPCIWGNRLFLTSYTANEEQSVTQSEAEAAVNRYVAAWSTCDASNVRDIVAYPHFIHRANLDRMLVYKNPDEYDVDRWAPYFAKLKASGYERSEAVKTRVLCATPLEVTVAVEWRRLTADGKELARGESIYILARKNPKDELRVQIRHSPRR
jgi:hypothetical protein